MKKFIKIIIILFMFIPFIVKGEEKDINLYMFYGEGCPHCEDELEFLSEYIKSNDHVTLYKYETWKNEENALKQKEVLKYFDEDSISVPLLVIGDQYIIGYGKGYTNKNIINLIEYYEKNEYVDNVGKIIGIVDGNIEGAEKVDSTNESKYNVPVLGEVNLKEISLPFIAMIIGLVDGINPCAMWILLFLITMLFGIKNKKRMLIIGFTFIISSGVVYALFMVSWLNIATYFNSVSLFRVIVGVVALLFGLYNIYNFCKTKEVGCNVVDEKKRNKIMERVKNIVSNNYFIVSVLATVVLAFIVNVIELACSLGLPVMFTQILSLNDLSVLQKIIYICIYIFFFILDDLVIFLIAYKTSKIKAISGKFGRYSHLIGGIIMLVIGILMIWFPSIIMFNL